MSAAEQSLMRGLALLQRQDFLGAVTAFTTACSLRRGYWEAHANLGVALKMLGRYDEAASQLRRALKLGPQSAELVAALANVLHMAGDFTEAAKLYRKAIDIAPRAAGIRVSYGALLGQTNRHADALAQLAKAHELEPGNPVLAPMIGEALSRLGRAEEALPWLRPAAAQPGAARATLVALIAALCAARRPEEAEPVARRVAEHFPAEPGGWLMLGNVLRDLGRWREASEASAREWQTSRNPLALVQKCLSLPMIPADEAEITTARAEFERGLDELDAAGLTLPLDDLAALPTSFLLSYHGVDNRDLQAKLARFYRRACPELTFTAPHLAQPRRDKGRLKVGLLSSYFHNHTIGQLFVGMIEALPKDRLEVILFAPPRGSDPIRQRLVAAADKVVDLPPTIAAARDAVAAERLDVLHYPDIGMNSFTYFLAFARLARLQTMGWGHPETTGIDTINLMLSCAAMEPPEGDSHYTERLVRLPGTTIHYDRPTPTAPPQRARLGIPAEATVYGCPQTLFKFHPRFDAVLAEILTRDPAGMLVLISDIAPAVNALLLERLKKAGVPADRVLFVPRQSRDGFLELLASMDVMLDPLHYSGGNTSLEAFALGTPIVTWPGAFMRGRHTAGFYQLMGVTDCIARDDADYAEKAVRLGTDPIWRNEVRGRILAANSVLYGDASAGTAMATAWEQAIAER